MPEKQGELTALVRQITRALFASKALQKLQCCIDLKEFLGKPREKTRLQFAFSPRALPVGLPSLTGQVVKCVKSIHHRKTEMQYGKQKVDDDCHRLLLLLWLHMAAPRRR